MKRALLVMRMDPAHAPDVARIFADSDATSLPQDIGVVHRSLYFHHGLYFHYIEAPDSVDGSIMERVHGSLTHPAFVDVSQRLKPFLSPFAPVSGRPGDAEATPFYTWNA